MIVRRISRPVVRRYREMVRGGYSATQGAMPMLSIWLAPAGWTIPDWARIPLPDVGELSDEARGLTYERRLQQRDDDYLGAISYAVDRVLLRNGLSPERCPW